MLRNYVQAASYQLISKAFMVISDEASSVQKYIQVCDQKLDQALKVTSRFSKDCCTRPFILQPLF